MTGKYSAREIRDIALGFASRLTPEQLRDVSQAIMETTRAAAAAGYCSPHWIDLNAIGIQLGLLVLDDITTRHETDELINP